MADDGNRRFREMWVSSESWIACFDILGFKKLVSVEGGENKVLVIQYQYEEMLRHLEKAWNAYRADGIDYLWLSDTFVMFTPDASAQSYVVIQDNAKYFMDRCLYNSHMPMRGAITVGALTRRKDNRVLMGAGFVDAYEYAQDQDWIGLILTPNAIDRIASYGGSLIYDFIASADIPMRKFRGTNVLAYRFQNGAANFPSPLLGALDAMQSQSGDEHRPKYESTKKFIKEHYSRL